MRPALFALLLCLPLPLIAESANGNATGEERAPAARADEAGEADERAAILEEVLRLRTEEALSREVRIESLENLLRHHPDVAEAWAALGELREQLGRDEAALLAFERAVTRDPSLHSSWHWIGILHKRKGTDLEAAARAFRRSREEGAPPAIALNELAVTYAMLGRMSDALEAWEEAIAIDPDWGVLYANAIRAALSLDRSSRARELFDASLEAERFEPIAVLRYTDYLVQSGDPDIALELYRQALEAAPDEPRIRYYYAATLREVGQNDEALDEFRRARDAATAADDEATLSVVRKAIFSLEDEPSMRRLIEAEELITNVTDDSRRGRRNLRRGIDLLDPIVEKYPDFWEPRLLRGIAHRRLGDNREARADFNAVLREVETQPNALVNLALLDRDEELPRSSVRRARQAVDAAPRDPQILVNAALVMIHAGECEQAEELSDRLEAVLPPDDAPALMEPLRELFAEKCG